MLSVNSLSLPLPLPPYIYKIGVMQTTSKKEMSDVRKINLR